MDIILHTGMHKTGTSSLQVFLRGLSERFPGRYPPMILDATKFNARQPARFDPDWIRRTLAEAQAAGWTRVFISGEVISTLHDHELPKLMDVLSGHDILTVTCFRHWVGFLPSRWRQNIIRCDTQSFGAYVRRLEALENEHIEARFDLIIDRFLRAGVTRQRFVSYDHANVDGQVVRTVLNTMSDADFGALGSAMDENRIHVGRQGPFSDLLRLFNGIRSIESDLPANMLFDSIHLGQMVKLHYKQINIVAAILRADDELHQTLYSIVHEATKTATLSSATPAFRRWEALLTERALADCVNAVDGRMFPEISAREFAYADLEVGDLPTSLRSRMSQALRRALSDSATA